MSLPAVNCAFSQTLVLLLQTGNSGETDSNVFFHCGRGAIAVPNASSDKTGCQWRSAAAPQHFLNFFPLPQGQGSLRPTFDCRVLATSRS